MLCPPHFQFVLLWYSSQASLVEWPAWFCSLGIFDAGAESHLGQCQEVDDNIAASPVKVMGYSYHKIPTAPQRHLEREENNAKDTMNSSSSGAHCDRHVTGPQYVRGLKGPP